jgi:protein-disulfide isomerase
MNSQTMPVLTVPVSAKDHIRGAKNAAVTLVEYGDYECPFCGQAHYVVEQLEQMLADSMRFVFRDFPLSTVHPHATQAAEAAEAAGAQKKFWPMHDTLFENQNALEPEDLLQYATMLDLDLPRFVRELNEHRYADRVREDFLGGVRSGVNGTPTFFINDVRHNGPFDLQSLLDAINGAVE